MDDISLKPDRPLEMSGDEFRQHVARVTEHLAKFLDSLAQQPTSCDANPWAGQEGFPEDLPQQGMPLEDLLVEVVQRATQSGYNTAGPGYMAYIPGGGIPATALADLLADILNRYVGIWEASPALVQLESAVVRWFCTMVGYGPASGGFLTTGGSLANWSGLYTAWAQRGEEDIRLATVYTSDQAHHSVAKAARLVGIRAEHVRQVATDGEFRVHVEQLAELLRADRGRGLRPLAIVGQAGTTNTGAVDDLSALSAVAQDAGVWLHVDAAYGGFFAFTERGRHRLTGLDRADSITLDPHKGLFLPYGTGSLLVRESSQLERAFRSEASYLPPPPAGPHVVDFSHRSPELTRGFRALRVWLPLKLHGLEPFRQNLDEKLDLALWACEQLELLNRDLGGQLEVVARPQLTVLAFRLHPSAQSEAELTHLNQELLRRINGGRRVFLSATWLQGRYVLRICILSFRTHADRVAECLAAIRAACRELL